MCAGNLTQGPGSARPAPSLSEVPYTLSLSSAPAHGRVAQLPSLPRSWARAFPVSRHLPRLPCPSDVGVSGGQRDLPGAADGCFCQMPVRVERGEAPRLSTIISLVRLMDEIVSNYPVEGPIMRLTFVGYKLMMRRASHLHSIKLIALPAEGWRAVVAGLSF